MTSMRRRSNALVKRGARAARIGAQAVRDMTITLLPSSVEVRQAVFGENGAFEALGPGKTLIDLSGTDPGLRSGVQEAARQKSKPLLSAARSTPAARRRL